MSGDDIVREIVKRAGSTSTGKCAAVVREAIEAALGCSLTRTYSAKDYGPSLTQIGFKPISSSDGLKPGDVRIIESMSGHPDGHMQVYVGQGQWASDFKQNGEWPGPAYRKEQPNYTTYRYSK